MLTFETLVVGTGFLEYYFKAFSSAVTIMASWFLEAFGQDSGYGEDAPLSSLDLTENSHLKAYPTLSSIFLLYLL